MNIINSLPDKLYLNIDNKEMSSTIELSKNSKLTFDKDNLLENPIFYEDKFYNLTLKNIPTNCSNLSVIIGEKEQENIEYHGISTIQIKSVDLFKCLYGWNNITVIIQYEDKITYYSSGFFCIATNKVSEIFIRDMINEIMNFNCELLIDIFSNSKAINTVKNRKINIELMLQFFEKTCEFFVKRYRNFKQNCKSKIIRVNTIANVKQANNLSNRSFRWIYENPQYLNNVNYNSNIKCGDVNYIPSKILSEENIISYNCYENQVILSFIEMLRKKALQILQYIEEIESLKIIKNKFKIKNGYVNIDRILEEYILEKNDEIKRRIYNSKKSFDKLYNQYSKLFSCNAIDIIVKPKFTDTFRQVSHYRESFSLIDEFFEYIDFDFKAYEYVMSIVTLDRMFECYCLISLIKVYKELGYNIERKDNCIINKDSEKTFILRKDNIEIDIFYQTTIDYKQNDSNEMITLKRRSYGHYIPDFIIKYKNISNNKSVYSIYDSKFSKLDNVRKFYLKEMCYKYYIDLFDEQKETIPIINLGLFSLLGNRGEKNWKIDKSDTNVLPKIHILQILLSDDNSIINNYFKSINSYAYKIIE